MDGREPPLHTLSPSLLPCVHALCSFSPSLTLALTSKVTPPLSTLSRSCINALTLAPSLPNSYSLPTCPCALTPQLIPRLVFLHLYSLPHSCSLLLPPLLTPLLPQSILHSLSCTHFLLTFQLISCAPPLTPCSHCLPKCTCALILHSYSLTPVLTLFHLRLLSHSCSPQSPLHSHSHVHPLTLPLALLLFPTCTRRTHSHSYLFLTCTPVPIHIYSCTSTMFLSPHLLSGARLPKCLCFLLHV